MSAIQIKTIDHVVIRARDIGALQVFYCDVLGCVPEREEKELGLLQLRAGDALIDLVAVDSKLGRMGGAAPAREGHNMDHLCLRLVEFDGQAITRWLEDKGVEPGEVVTRNGAEGQGPSIYIEDPEGNTIELKGSAD